jgi:hypothetical protein
MARSDLAVMVFDAGNSAADSKVERYRLKFRPAELHCRSDRGRLERSRLNKPSGMVPERHWHHVEA